MSERRAAPRLRSYLGARLVFNRRQSVFDCLVRNISANGARVQFPDTVCLPSEIDLEIRHLGQTHRARVMWRTPTEMGLAFERPGGLAAGNVVVLDDHRRGR